MKKYILLALLGILFGCAPNGENNIPEQKIDSASIKRARYDSLTTLLDSQQDKTMYYILRNIDHLGTRTGMQYNDSAKMSNKRVNELMEETYRKD